MPARKVLEEIPKIATKKSEPQPKVTTRAIRQPKARKKLSIKCELCIKEFTHQRNLLEHMK